MFSYNPVTDTLTALSSADDWPGNPPSPGNILPGGFAVLNNKLYTIGDFMISPATMLSDVWEFDPSQPSGSRWTLKSGLPVEHGYVPATVIGGMIYTAGGAVISGTTLADSFESYKYDPVADTWTSITNIPRATGETRAVTINGKMWVLGGGRTDPNPSNEVDIYDPATDSWSVGPPFMSARRNFPADTDGSHIWLAGGYDAANTLQNTMEIFTLAGLTPTPTHSPSPTPTATSTSTGTPTPTPTGSPTPFAITPNMHDFGAVAIRTSSGPVRFTITNRSNQTYFGMTYTFSPGDGSSFSRDFVLCGTILTPGSSCTLDVRFTPSTIGRKTATLDVYSQAGVGAMAVLTGTAIANSGFDYDFDGRSDISIFRPSTSEWYVLRSTGGVEGLSYGIAGDRPVPADYDGDGKADIAIYRPSEGLWAILNSSNQTFSYYLFGYEDDMPVPADYSGDDRTDICVFRPSTGIWYWRDSTNGHFNAVQFGATGDRPTIGDFDRDGKSDVAVFHPSSGVWYHLLSSTGQPYGERFGIASDVLVPADYDGDGQTDLGVYRPSTGIWYLRISSTGMWSYRVFGLSDDIPAPGDYDGDGLADICVFRPSNGNWYWQNSSDGSYNGFHFGTNGDKPTEAAYSY